MNPILSPASHCTLAVRPCLFDRAGRLLRIGLALAWLAGGSATGWGVERTWTGAGTDAYWRTAANWASGLPRDGDDLVFPFSAARKVNTNDFPSLSIGSMTFTGTGGGYRLRGNTLAVAGGVGASGITGENRIELPLNLEARQTFDVGSVLSTLVVSGDIALGANSLTLDAAGTMTLSGAISGTGALVKRGTGTAILDGPNPNTFSGTCTVQAGWLHLAKATGLAVPGNLTVQSSALWRADNQLSGTSAVTVRQGLMNLDGYRGNAGSLTLQGGTLTTGAGTLQVNGPVSSLADANASVIQGRLHLGQYTRVVDVADGTAADDLWIQAVIIGGSSGSPPFVIDAGLTKTGAGTLRLSGDNTYGGLTTISDGCLIAATDYALGLDTGGVSVNDPGRLELVDAQIGPKRLSLSTPAVHGVVLAARGDCGWAGRVMLNEIVTVDAADTLVFSGSLQGDGGLVLEGNTIEFTGTEANTYTGPTTAHCSLLTLRKPSGVAAVGVELTVGGKAGGPHVVNPVYSGQFPASAVLTVLRSGTLLLNKEHHVARDLIMSGGLTDTRLGTLEITGSIQATSSTDDAEIEGTLRLPRAVVTEVASGLSLHGLRINAVIEDSPGFTGGVVKRGGGSLWLANANTFTGNLSIEEGSVQAAHAQALGAASGGTVVAAGAALVLRAPTDALSEPLTLTGGGPVGQGALRVLAAVQNHAKVTLSHGATLNIDGAASFLLDSALDGGGALVKLGDGLLRFAGDQANTLTGDIIVNQGTLELDKSAMDGAVLGNLYIGDGVGADTVRLLRSTQIDYRSAVIMAASGVFDLNDQKDGIGTIQGEGNVLFGGAGTARLTLNGGADAVFAGLISGVADGTRGLYMHGSGGTLTLTGHNTYTGVTFVDTGVLVVNGNQPTSPVVVTGDGALAGDGMVGDVTGLSGSIAPGPGVALLTTGNLRLEAACEVSADLQSGLSDRLVVRGTVTLNSPRLTLNTAGALLGLPGSQRVLINNDGTDAVSGTFDGLPEDTLITVGWGQFRISYAGGDGNDVSLTYVGPILTPVEWTLADGNGNGIVDPNECSELTLVISNGLPDTVSGLTIQLLPIISGALFQDQAAYPDLAPGAQSASLTPFKLATFPSFPVGGDLRAHLNLYMPTGMIAQTLVTLPGVPTAPVEDGGGVCEICPDQTIRGLIGPDTPLMAGAYDPTGTGTTCGLEGGLVKFADAPTRYAAFTLVNGESNACVSLTLTSPQPFFCVVYTNEFFPEDPRRNAWACPGNFSDNNNIEATCSFNLEANQRVVLVVHRPGGVTDGGSYKVVLSGGSCQPTLRIRPAGAGEVALEWSTAAYHYQAEETPGLGPPGSWQPLPAPPRVVDGRYTVTNTPAATPRFYRLEQP
ncbi:MAG TPA: autotransporter-associated beta strand repeat-containing protein [Verrucomicrobiota bacterium]|nr:autotransporter-associated beta strand repeat-containing protein [Verrucomicrobiota bacterium]HNU50560.1 autotransporter-associated beta strand repeat-containing protein [Verrucomicrobiota bacterium]